MAEQIQKRVTPGETKMLINQAGIILESSNLNIRPGKSVLDYMRPCEAHVFYSVIAEAIDTLKPATASYDALYGGKYKPRIATVCSQLDGTFFVTSRPDSDRKNIIRFDDIKKSFKPGLIRRSR